MTKHLHSRDGWLNLSPNQGVMLTPELATSWQRQQRTLRQIRGNIIAETINIELAVDVAIREHFFPNPSPSGSITFANKIKILKQLIKEMTSINEEERKRILALLKKVREIRNLFAHIPISFEPSQPPEPSKVTPYIIEKDKRTYLNDQYFVTLNQTFRECLIRVENITRRINKQPLQDPIIND